MANAALDLMIEVTFAKEDDFLRIKETLTRIGVSSETEKRLYPSVVILHKKARYYLSHFKFLFMMDGKSANITDEDIRRFKTITYLLHTWGVASIIDPVKIEECKKVFDPKLVKILPFHAKQDWEIIHKYTVGGKH